MFKKLLFFVVALVAAAQAWAAPVDVAAAKAIAQQYLVNKVYAGKFMAPAATEPVLIMTEMGKVNKETPVFYIFNTSTTYLVVAADDRAEQVLAYGDKPLNLDRIPDGLKDIFACYQEELDWLVSNPDEKVEKIVGPQLRAGETYGPLLTAIWDQEAPFWSQCKFTYSGSTYQCLTGCPATSASMVLYYWKYPTDPVGPLASYTANLSLSYWNSVSFTYPELPQTTFDWDNMIDDYTGSYTTAQGNAVATLMRYCGQAESMMYGTSSAGGSGIYTTDAQNIADMFIAFGYDESTTRLALKSDYTEATWAQLLQEELAEGRPVVFMAVDASGNGGHAFNVDGYNSSTNKYHVNFGWSGDGNNWYAMNAFSYGGYTFSSNQMMTVGIQPPMGAIKATPSEVNFQGFAGETYTQTVKVQARNLESDINIEKVGSDVITVSHTTITAAEAANGVNVVVTYAPTEAGTVNAALNLSCADEDVESVSVPITGVAQPRVPTLIVEPQAMEFSATLDKSVTKTFSLTGAFLTHDVTITLNDTKGVFTVMPTTISQSSTDVNTPVTVAVTFKSAAEGTFTGSITIASEDAESKTVNLTAVARDGGAASDPFLNIANYETIDEAGASVTGMSSIYKYTEYEDDECAWLTVSNYGAMKADETQNWITSSSLTSYSNDWSATDVFPGQNAYFGSSQAYSVYGSNDQSFYVTNCTQVKAYVKGSSYSSSSATLSIYECSLNVDGSLTPSSTTTDTKQVSSGVVASAELDASKIYMVKLAGGGSFPDLLEIGFKTPFSSIEIPVALPATEVKANGFTANWSSSPSATSYTLRVMPKPAATLLMTETFEKCVSAGGIDIGQTLDNYLDNPGWSGSKVYTAVDGIRLGTGSALGVLTSPALDLSADNKVSIIMKAQTLNSDTDCGLKVSCGSASETITVPDKNVAEYTLVLDCSAADQKVKFETVANSKRVIITEVEFYSGDVTKPIPAKGFDENIFTGITDLNYKVTGLQPGITYLYDVKAVNGDKQSKWSNKIEVLTLTGITGDVNGDGDVNVMDITELIDVIMSDGDNSRADVNKDGEINVMDITSLIDIIMNS